MNETLKLSAETVLHKKFQRELKGYDPYEVDEFLDLVIADYQNIEQYLAKNDAYVSSLQERIKELQSVNDALIREKANLSSSLKKKEIELAGMNNRYGGIKESDKPTAENLHMIKRLNEYEAFLKANGFTDADLDRFLGKD